MADFEWKNGIPNQGNTCFFNTTIQLFMSCFDIMEWKFQLDPKIEIHNLFKLLRNAKKEEIRYIVSELNDHLNYSNKQRGAQNDPVRVISSILEESEKGEKKIIKKSDMSKKLKDDLIYWTESSSELSNLFLIVLFKGYWCDKCNKSELLNEQRNFMINLSQQKVIKNSLQQSVQEISFHKETNWNNDTCPTCSLKRENINGFLKLPQFIFVNLDKNLMPSLKIEENIEFTDQISNKQVQYSLSGFVCHPPGHYTYWRKQSNGKWTEFNDSWVSQDNDLKFNSYMNINKKGLLYVKDNNQVKSPVIKEPAKQQEDNKIPKVLNELKKMNYCQFEILEEKEQSILIEGFLNKNKSFIKSFLLDKKDINHFHEIESKIRRVQSNILQHSGTEYNEEIGIITTIFDCYEDYENLEEYLNTVFVPEKLKISAFISILKFLNEADQLGLSCCALSLKNIFKNKKDEFKIISFMLFPETPSKPKPFETIYWLRSILSELIPIDQNSQKHPDIFDKIIDLLQSQLNKQKIIYSEILIQIQQLLAPVKDTSKISNQGYNLHSIQKLEECMKSLWNFNILSKEDMKEYILMKGLNENTQKTEITAFNIQQGFISSYYEIERKINNNLIKNLIIHQKSQFFVDTSQYVIANSVEQLENLHEYLNKNNGGQDDFKANIFISIIEVLKNVYSEKMSCLPLQLKDIWKQSDQNDKWGILSQKLFTYSKSDQIFSKKELGWVKELLNQLFKIKTQTTYKQLLYCIEQNEDKKQFKIEDFVNQIKESSIKSLGQNALDNLNLDNQQNTQKYQVNTTEQIREILKSKKVLDLSLFQSNENKITFLGSCNNHQVLIRVFQEVTYQSISHYENVSERIKILQQENILKYQDIFYSDNQYFIVCPYHTKYQSFEKLKLNYSENDCSNIFRKIIEILIQMEIKGLFFDSKIERSKILMDEYYQIPYFYSCYFYSPKLYEEEKINQLISLLNAIFLDTNSIIYQKYLQFLTLKNSLKKRNVYSEFFEQIQNLDAPNYLPSLDSFTQESYDQLKGQLQSLIILKDIEESIKNLKDQKYQSIQVIGICQEKAIISAKRESNQITEVRVFKFFSEKEIKGYEEEISQIRKINSPFIQKLSSSKIPQNGLLLFFSEQRDKINIFQYFENNPGLIDENVVVILTKILTAVQLLQEKSLTMYNLKDPNCIQIVSNQPFIEFCLDIKSSSILTSLKSMQCLINQKYLEDYEELNKIFNKILQNRSSLFQRIKGFFSNFQKNENRIQLLFNEISSMIPKKTKDNLEAKENSFQLNLIIKKTNLNEDKNVTVNQTSSVGELKSLFFKKNSLIYQQEKQYQFYYDGTRLLDNQKISYYKIKDKSELILKNWSEQDQTYI